VVDRLPLYARTLSQLAHDGRKFIRSHELGDLLTLHPEQIRKDLSYFGHLGKPGFGYDVCHLDEELRRILGLGKRRCTVLVGVGNLGRAILANSEFEASGFGIVTAFDVKHGATRATIRDVPVLPVEALPEYLARHSVEVAIVAVPPARAQAISDELVRGGVRAILNYAPVALRVPSRVLVRSIDPVAKLQAMAFYTGAREPGHLTDLLPRQPAGGARAQLVDGGDQAAADRKAASSFGASSPD